MEVLRLEDVFFSYGKQVVLEGVSLTVREGDFLALIGPNGSGKTTLVKIVLGLLKPMKGKVFLFGTETGRFSEWYRVGYVPQRPALDTTFPSTVAEVVAAGRFGRVGLGRRLKRGDWQAIEEAMEVVGLLPLYDRPVTELSGGQQQRAFIARALAGQPDLLILDEPQVGLDDRALHEFYRLLRYLNCERGITLLMVSHDVGVVGRWVSRVACLNRTLICHGTPQEVLNPINLSRLYGTEVRAVAHSH
ncbi:MAG TPA: metal ABC transporter ATP-binding protein [Syntrophomonadaceae bacterium]|nr:metal ABC transporter ATP-binding protein [Syntrophomonadaceae bacterium]